MKHALRVIGGMFAGLFVAVVIISTVEAVSTIAYPFPKDLDVNDQAAVKAYIATLPAGAFAFVLAAYFLGTLAGTWITARLNRELQRRPGLVVGGLLFVAAIVNMLSIPHPGWFVILCLLVFPVATVCGVWLARPKGA